MWKTSLNFESDEKLSFNISINSEKENKNEIQNIEWNTKIKTNFWLEFFYSSSIGIMLMEAIPEIIISIRYNDYIIGKTFPIKMILSLISLTIFWVLITIQNKNNEKARMILWVLTFFLVIFSLIISIIFWNV